MVRRYQVIYYLFFIPLSRKPPDFWIFSYVLTEERDCHPQPDGASVGQRVLMCCCLSGGGFVWRWTFKGLLHTNGHRLLLRVEKSKWSSSCPSPDVVGPEQRSGVWFLYPSSSHIHADLSCFCWRWPLPLVSDWSHSTAVSGETHPQAQETVPVGCPGPFRRHQHQPGVWERLPQRQSPQSGCCPPTPGPLTVQPLLPGPLSRHPKLQRHHRTQQHSATHSDIQTGLWAPESDCQRHEPRGQQGRGEEFRKKRRAPEDLTRRPPLPPPPPPPPYRLKRRPRLLAVFCHRISARMTDKSAAK